MLATVVSLAGTLLLSLGLGLYLTPIVRRGALAFGVLDRPDGRLKHQREPVPYLGGIAVYLAFLLTLALVFEFDAALLGLLLGGTLVVMLGLFDDLKVLPPHLKLAGQLLAALVLIKSGVRIELEMLPDWLDIVLTVLWLVGVTNALNILDVSDGLAAGVGAVASAVLGIVAWLNGDPLITTAAWALTGSLVGFLRYNRPPATIYLGDAGSLFVGFMLAALSMIGAYTRRNPVGVLAPVAILAVPLLEVALVSTARLARGHSPLHGSLDHFALRLAHRGIGARPVALGAAIVGAVCGGLGIVMILRDTTTAAIIAGALGLVGLGLLGWLLKACPPPAVRPPPA